MHPGETRSVSPLVSANARARRHAAMAFGKSFLAFWPHEVILTSVIGDCTIAYALCFILTEKAVPLKKCERNFQIPPANSKKTTRTYPHSPPPGHPWLTRVLLRPGMFLRVLRSILRPKVSLFAARLAEMRADDMLALHAVMKGCSGDCKTELLVALLNQSGSRLRKIHIWLHRWPFETSLLETIVTWLMIMSTWSMLAGACFL